MEGKEHGVKWERNEKEKNADNRENKWKDKEVKRERKEKIDIRETREKNKKMKRDQKERSPEWKREAQSGNRREIKSSKMTIKKRKKEKRQKQPRKFWKQFIYGGNWEKHILVVIEIPRLRNYFLLPIPREHVLTTQCEIFLKIITDWNEIIKLIKKMSHLWLIYHWMFFVFHISKMDTNRLLS